MPEHRLAAVLTRLRMLAAPPRDEDSDRALLERFARGRDEEAFTELVQRHGPLVFGVCRRILGDVHAAEDAYQATFLVLAKKAAALHRRGTLAGWLYTVATHAALKARAAAQRRQECERQVVPMPPSGPADEPDWRDLRPVLDEEVNRLPDRYRTPFVLCCLDGRTNEEAARLLGCPVGTVLSRLSRARERLRGRLTRRGITLSAAGLAIALAEGAAPAAVPVPLLSSTVKAALRVAAGETTIAAGVGAPAAVLVEGVLRTMLLTKLKIAALVVLALTAFGTGTGVYLAATRGEAAPGETATATLVPLPDDADRVKAVEPPSKEELQKAEKAVRDALAGTDVVAVNLLDDKRILRTFPGQVFFDVRFNYNYGVPLGIIQGSTFWVVPRQGGQPVRLGGMAPRGNLKPKGPDLKKFLQENLPALKTDDALKDALWTCVRLAQEAAIEHGWMEMGIDEKSLQVTAEDGGKTATGKSVVKPGRGARGEIAVTLQVDRDGKVRQVDVQGTVIPGPKPKCQATRLLDPDPVIRALAEQQLLLMGRYARDYMADRRAKADSEELRQAIDRMSERIAARERLLEAGKAPVVQLIRPPESLRQHPDQIVRAMAEQQLRLIANNQQD